MSVAYEILKYLENKGIGTEGTDLFIGFEPDSPKNCTTFYDEAAINIPESACLKVDLFGVQVLVRNENYHTCEDKIKTIHKKIVGFGGLPLIDGGDVISYITVETSPFSLGKDDEGKNKWTAHYYVRTESKNDDFRL